MNDLFGIVDVTTNFKITKIVKFLFVDLLALREYFIITICKNRNEMTGVEISSRLRLKPTQITN